MSIDTNKIKFTKVFALMLASVSHAAMAQEAGPAASKSEVVAEGDTELAAGEIVVTAQKRAERLQDVPVAISAISGDELASRRITGPDQLVSTSPNLQVASTVGESTPIFSLRGISMSDYSLNQSGPVATYYDEVYKGNFALLGVALYDLERVEVLRGPQGTLYGKNTTGGAVNLISRKPTFDTNGYISVGYGNYNRFDASGALNVPLGDTVAVRVAFTTSHANGWFKNRLHGQPDMNEVREYGIRGSLLWEPSDGVSFLLRASTSLRNPVNYGVYPIPGPDGVGAGVYESYGTGHSYFRHGLGNYEIESNPAVPRYERATAVSLTANAEVGGGLTVTSISSYDKGEFNYFEDTDGSPVRTFDVDYKDRVTQITQDLRLASDWGGGFNFLLGAYYNREKVYNLVGYNLFLDLDTNGDHIVDGVDCHNAFPLACSGVNQFDQLKHSYALYTDLRFELSPGLTLRGGLRFTRDDGRQIGLRSNLFSAQGEDLGALIAPTDLSYETNNVSGKIGVDFKASRDVLLYGNYSRGYRGRSFNGQAIYDLSEASVARPEIIDSFEIGAKTSLFDRRVTFNAAGFYYIYKDQQFINLDPATGSQTLINVDRSRILGAEFELTVRPNDAITARAGLGIISSQITKGELSGESLKGNKLSNAPAVSLTAGIDFTAYDDGENRVSFHPDIYYVSKQYFEVFNKDRISQEGYVLLNGRIDYTRGPLTVSIWGKNLANKFYFTSRYDISGFGFDYQHVGTPRTFGGSVTYKF